MRTPILALATLLPLMAAGAEPREKIDPHQWRMTAGTVPGQISPHVWMLRGNPNIAVIVGDSSVLVVDTGLGPDMAKIAMIHVRRLAPGRRIFLTTTHFHPEHAAGDSGFSSGTTIVRNDVQQTEIDHDGMAMVKFFASRSDENRRLLEHAHFVAPDVTFHESHWI